jgi:zona occludens toxin
MINGIVGRPRTGKSYEAVRYHIVPTLLKDKRLIVTNIPVNKEYIAKVHGQEFADLVIVVDGQFSAYGQVKPFSHEKDFLEYSDWKNEKGQGPLFVIDEIHLCVGTRNARPELLEYFSLHGHYGHDHLILTQNARKIHRDLKDMTEIVWRTTKLSAFGKDDTYLQNTHHGFENLKNAVHQEQRAYDPEWFPYYKSHTQTEGSVIEATAKQVKGVLNPYKKMSYAMFAVGGLIIAFVLSKIFLPEEPAVAKTPTFKTPEKQLSDTTNQINPLKSILPEPLSQGKIEDKKDLGETENLPKIKTNKSVNEGIKDALVLKSKEYHPFHKVDLHISGFSNDASLRSINYYFAASRNGQELFTLDLKDLYLAGYSVNVLGECVVQVEYYNFTDFIICDTPTVGTQQTLTAQN